MSFAHRWQNADEYAAARPAGLHREPLSFFGGDCAARVLERGPSKQTTTADLPLRDSSSLALLPGETQALTAQQLLQGIGLCSGDRAHLNSPHEAGRAFPDPKNGYAIVGCALGQ